MEKVRDHVKDLANKYGRNPESLLPIMQDVLREERGIPDYYMKEIARELDLPASKVYGTATFYSFLSTEHLGKYVIRVCKTITCSMHGNYQILEALRDQLKIDIGETTKNQKFTLLETNCLGWCHKGPVMLINDEVHTELTPEKVRNIISDYVRNK